MQARLYLGGATWHLLVGDSTGRQVVDALRLAAVEGGDAMEEADLALRLYGLSRQGEWAEDATVGSDCASGHGWSVEVDRSVRFVVVDPQGELVRGPFATHAEATEVFYREVHPEDAGAAVEVWSEAQLTAWCRPRCPNCGALWHHLDQCER
ncbi:MAG: hypothetical protein M0035_01440 [Actinomycetota bacterium]|jgi:hypothetical protein|nr:hypothetical protein [Actinomycetota bacterium]